MIRSATIARSHFWRSSSNAAQSASSLGVRTLQELDDAAPGSQLQQAHFTLLLERPVNGRPGDFHLPGDLGGALALRLEFAHLRDVYRVRPALISAFRPCLSDTFMLALLP